MEKVEWKVDGMDCANCALSIHTYLKKNGAENVSVNVIDGDVSFELNGNTTVPVLAKGIESLGYKVASADKDTPIKNHFYPRIYNGFYFAAFYGGIDVTHDTRRSYSFLMNPWVQLVLTLPYF
jgi:Cu+-exporting ATPase